MRSSIKRLFSRRHLDNIKVVRRVIVSVVGATVVLIGIALLVLPGPAFVVIPVGLAILATEYAWARRWLRKVRRIANDVVSGRKRTSVPDLVSSSHRGEDKKDAADSPEQQTYNPKPASSCQGGNRSDGNCDLEHSHGACEHFVLVKK